MVRFQTTTKVLGDRAIVRIRGYLSGLGGEQLEDKVDGLLAEGSRRVELDFSETDLVNSVGVSILIGVIEKVRDSGANLAFTGLTPVNEEIFRIMGLHKHVSFLRTEGGAKRRGHEA